MVHKYRVSGEWKREAAKEKVSEQSHGQEVV